jgi:hypothetical protein
VRAQFHDLNDVLNPFNGRWLTDVRSLFDTLHGKRPFMAELIGDNGYMFLLGLGPEIGFAQFSTSNDAPPYLVAVDTGAGPAEGDIDFFMSGEPSPLPKRLCLPISVIAEIAQTFVLTGKRKADITWEEI